MSSLIPDVLFRDYQVELLESYLLDDPNVSPLNLFIQGYKATGKTYTLEKYFQYHPDDLLHAWIKPLELVSWKPFIQAIARTVQETLQTKYPSVSNNDDRNEKEEDEENLKRLDTLSVEEPYLLMNFLETILSKYATALMEPRSFYLILDGFDSFHDLDTQLIQTIFKLSEILNVSNGGQQLKIKLKFIHIIQDSSFLNRYTSYCLPTIIFPRYNIDELIEILIFSRSKDLLMNYKFTEKCNELLIFNNEEKLSIVINFIQLIIQSFNSYTGNDIYAINDLIDFKWEIYVDGMNSDNISNPLALYKKTLKIFTSTDCSLVQENDNEQQESDTVTTTTTYSISKMSKYLLIAAYLCSYLEPRFDSFLFSLKSELKTGRSSTGRRKKKDINPRFLQASLFSIERLLAIFQNIYPMEMNWKSGSLASLGENSLIRSNVEVFQNLAELDSLKLLATTKNIDLLNHKNKWKVNVPWEIIEEVAKSVDFDINQYFSGIHD
ncbi:origin recognition complex subunit 5 NDAI_0C00190 [Naumovozyma dairenensis CBS 421]|uniref:Uncharacterized protein n=1 Tax=Naumovozyma dairenensis (strain ATCC 10597 / BCRC 20456 / CBS 421 / NBRC 0211 / NRRL Y-12639) TaxID=1071378 RepID=G0W7B9_NAUDC|nr:hypothetical protein NDAI_0C00190 [Naumovozyma dairenensis CBS 421]CCD23680.1 hypothetical protein NDAI_0C00190 [Naumovozyma dairenensis CBS 421]